MSVFKGMHCLEARKRIEHITSSDAPADGLIQHVQSCELCRERYGNRLLEFELLEVDGPEPREGLVDDVIRNAIAAGTRHRRWPLAAAASFLVLGIATMLVLGMPERSDESSFVQHVALAPYEGKLVRVLIDSADDRPDATVTIELAEHLELEGFPDTQVVSFQTGLLRGKNLLALPLTLIEAKDSYFNVGLSYGTTQTQLRVHVRATDSRSAEISL